MMRRKSASASSWKMIEAQDAGHVAQVSMRPQGATQACTQASTAASSLTSQACRLGAPASASICAFGRGDALLEQVDAEHARASSPAAAHIPLRYPPPRR